MLYNKTVFELSINFHVHKTVSEKKFSQYIIGLCIHDIISNRHYRAFKLIISIEGKKLIVDFSRHTQKRRAKNNERIDFLRYRNKCSKKLINISCYCGAIEILSI